jgi:flagellar motor switch protein FliN/FliY
METPIDLGCLEGVPLLLEADLGRRKILLSDLLRLEVGSVIRLGRKTGEALEVYAGGSRIGQAEVAFWGQGREIRITEVGDAQ